MKRKPLLWSLLLFLGAAAGLCLLLYVVGWFLRPDMSVKPPAYSEEALRAVGASREMKVDLEHPPVIRREVDYDEGPAAAWWPKTEAPILAELVAEGKLPPVQQRVGPEPLVLEGVEGVGTYGGTWIRLASSDHALPIPLLAPVTIATFPASSPIIKDPSTTNKNHCKPPAPGLVVPGAEAI